MGKKLYVGNLPFSVREQELQDMFAQVGQVESAKVITDRDTGRSKGFGFVEMASEDEANAAIAKFNGNDFQGRPLNVTEAKPQAPRERGSFDRGGFGGPRQDRGGSGGGGGGFRGGNRDGFSKRGF